MLPTVLAAALALVSDGVLMCPPALMPHRCSRHGETLMKQTTRKKSKPKAARPTKISTKGFGARPTGAGSGKVLEDPEYESLYEWLRSSPLTNLRKVGVGDFGGLRGVMALQDIGTGEEIVSIPAEFAVDLGVESADPLIAARRLVAELHGDEEGEYAPYWAVLPPPDSPDLCTPDFFSEKELQMMQWPPLVVETRQRSAQLRKVLGAAAPSGDTPNSLMSAAGGGMRELRWAVWIVLSRVLTVVDPIDPAGHKLLIPFLDLFNHDATTKNYLTGRTDGHLRVVAGAPVRAGEQVFIRYGTEQTSNVEFVGHYGFVDPRATEADRALVRMSADYLPALSHTTVEEDEALLAASPPPPYQEALALRLRLALKRAAVQEGLL